MFFENLIRTIRADFHAQTERGKLGRSAAGTAAMKIVATGIAFISSLLYARVLGPHGYGLYAYVIAWTAVLSIPASLGLPQYLIREGAKLEHASRWLLRWADRRVVITGLASALILSCAVFLPEAAGARWLFVVAAPIPLIANLCAVRQSLLQARGEVIQSQWPQLIFAPAFTLIFLVLFWCVRGSFQPIDVVIATATAALVQLGINAVQLRRPCTNDKSDGLDAFPSLNAALPFMWIGALYLVMSKIDLILLGSLKGASAAGIYAIASRAAEFVPFFLISTNAAIAPKISHLYHSGDIEKLQRLATASARRLMWITLPPALILIVLARFLIELFYGSRYVEGAAALQILVVAQFFTIASGPVGILLNMTEHASLSAKAFAFGAALNILLNLMLIPTFGYTGAATATAISIVVCNVLRWYWVRKHLHIRPSVFNN